MAHQALNMAPHLSPSEILSLQKPSANKYANFVGRDEELPPGQVANMLDMARGLTLMEDWVQKNPESETVVSGFDYESDEDSVISRSESEQR